MRRYVIRRLLQAVLMLLIMSVAFFALLHAIPGGPAATIGANNPRLTPEARANIARRLGLDKPLPLQYAIWLGSAVRGDFGYSLVNSRPVGNVIGDRISATLELFLMALTFALIIAIILGVLAAVRQYSITDYMITIGAYAGISMPLFWFALILQEFFGVQLRILPVYGIAANDTTGFTSLELFEDRAVHLVLPTIVLSLLFIAAWSRYLRSSMLDVIKQDYIRTARAKGLGARTVFFRHALRNALIPLVTVVALSFGGIAGGAVITENVFAWPGLGSLFFQSLDLPDYPVLLAFLVMGSASVILFNLVADVLYAVIDPRIRYS
ncbi:MAG: ABC transporter permease [Ktedonobacterales bacterium]|nr:ABC transporter permease [Ktedonobacterales bacterium]